MKTSEKLLQMIEEGTLDRDTLINSCLNYMSEADIQDMAESEGFIEDEDQDDNQEDDAESFLYDDPDEVLDLFNSEYKVFIQDNPSKAGDICMKREMFSAFIDNMQKEGDISEDLANNITLPEDD